MPRYRKRPVVIEAHQWHRNGDHPEDAATELFNYPDGLQRPRVVREGAVVRYFRRPDVRGYSLCSECGRPFHDHGWIDTLEDWHRVCPGDWIITGVSGERYPCKPDIFERTYQPAGEARYAIELSALALFDLHYVIGAARRREGDEACPDLLRTLVQAGIWEGTPPGEHPPGFVYHELVAVAAGRCRKLLGYLKRLAAFYDLEEAVSWMTLEHPDLEVAPVQALAEGRGAEVEAIINRLESGAYV